MKRNASASLSLLVATATIFLLTGCQTPSVTLKNALLKGLSTTKMDIGLNLELFNPNTYQIPLQTVDYKLDLFNTRFTDGETRFTKQVGPNSRTDVEVPLGVRYSAVQIGAKSLLTSSKIPWGVAGGCAFKTPAGPIRVDFGDSGQWRNPLIR